MKNSKSIILSVLLSMISCHSLFSQISFSHATGASIYVTTESTSAWGFMYSPRLNILEISDALTVSVGTHIGLGLTANSRQGASSLALDIPLVVELNFGNSCHPESDGNFGGFVGVGYGISKIGEQGALGFSDFNEANGLVVNGGIRLFINDLPLGARFSYLINSKKDETQEFADVYSLGIFYTLK